MTQPGKRSISAVAGLVAALILSGCGGSPGPEPTNASSAATQAKASATRSAPPTSAPTAEPQPVDREVFAFTGFISPTGNVACMIDVGLARCDIIDHDWSPPPRPADCEFDYGQGIEIVAGEPASFVCAGDTAFGPDEVLRTAIRSRRGRCAATARTRASRVATPIPETGSRSH
ncbi:MAG: hypothetical protein ACXWZ2_19225 [Mycobacterium sp.]